jgi:hypothetical protein
MQFFYFIFALVTLMMSNSVEQTIELLRQVQNSLPLLSPGEWVGFRLVQQGKVMAGKNVRENPEIYSHIVSVFEAQDEWTRVAETLDVQNRFRQAFVSLSREETESFKQKVRETMSGSVGRK